MIDQRPRRLPPRLTPAQCRKVHRGICINRSCPRKAAERRFQCDTCKGRAFAMANPIRIKWLNLRKSAKRRGLVFDLTPFPRFKEWAEKFGYVEFGEHDVDGLTVDRIDETGGYTWDNVQVMPNGENARKHALLHRARFIPEYKYFADCPY